MAAPGLQAQAEHSQRLVNSANIMGFKLPYGRKPRSRRRPTLETFARSGLADAYVRPIAWRGSETVGVSRPRQLHPPRHRRLAMAELLLSPAEKLKGIRLDMGASTVAPIR